MRSDRPSATARLVARGIAYVARDPRWRHLVPPDAAAATDALLLACFPGERRLLARFDRPIFRAFVAVIESMTSPGILLHYALRKQYLEAVAEAAIGEGFGQVVVLGAGLDTLALRQHRVHGHVLYVEVDHQATQACKRPGSYPTS
jgi:O-methyltransferase involved in polyketide biosynthesis